MQRRKTGLEAIGDGIIIEPIDTGNIAVYRELLERNNDQFNGYAQTLIHSLFNIQTRHSHISNKLTEHIKNKEFYFGITNGHGVLIGCMCIYKIDWRLPKADLFCFIEKGYPGVGILTSSFTWFVDFCFSKLGMEKLVLNLHAENENLYKVATKNGFEKEATRIRQFATSEIDKQFACYGLWRIQQNLP